MSFLEVDKISKSFDQTEVLSSVSLSIHEGEFISLVGPSGCGKSTLLRVIAGLEEQTTGDIRIAGNGTSGVRAADRNLAMVFQSYALYPHLTVAENLAVPLRMRNLSALQRLPLVGGLLPISRQSNASIRAKINAVASSLEIDHLMDRKPGQLSGGQKQRVALGRAIVREPAAFLFDEPLSNLDAKLRVQTRSEIAQLHRRLGTTFVYVTHDQVEAMTMSTRIAVLMQGQILQCDKPENIYEDPDDIRVAEFIGSPKINIINARVTKGQLVLPARKLPLGGESLPDQPIKIGLRPEALKVVNHHGAFTGTVTHLENLGSESYIQFSSDTLSSDIMFRAQSEERKQIFLGDVLSLDFTLTDALVFDASGKRAREIENRLQSQLEAA